MEDLIDLLSDQDTVLRGYIALVGAKIVGHKYMGQDRTLALSFNHNEEALESKDVIWCYIEKERDKAPLLYPVISKPEEDED
ncbi:MAG: hypothetical protein JRG97_04655 [Deltaproteobacteria bacterium]|nr:hypothetical protein [Deltaproteobacteria bacterium]MBW2051506.1 hypothetical protein [Deltaproteobacteria bacterium]MBW2140346.1 hypothetical protein [Deltaproteobacteria bacterium]MBW2323743.1 hypothetical protein [Deltaproteobacteria bacterium]